MLVVLSLFLIIVLAIIKQCKVAWLVGPSLADLIGSGNFLTIWTG